MNRALLLAGCLPLFSAAWSSTTGHSVAVPSTLHPTAATAVDYARLADAVVNRSLKLARGERVILWGDKSLDRGMMAALRQAITQSGGTFEDIAAPTRATTQALTPQQRVARDAGWKSAFARADAAIWLPSATDLIEDKPFEHLVEGSKVRSIHFHWFLPPDAADVEAAERMLEAAIHYPPDALRRRMEAVERVVRGATVRVIAPHGTDVSFDVPREAWMHFNTGDASPAKVAKARSVRDREEELPASVLRTTDIRNVNGTVVAYAAFDTRGALLRATLTGGKLVKLESVRGGEAVVQRWQNATGAKDIPGEFVLSVNPALTAVLPSGFMPYYGYGAGIVRLAIGDNWESGGRNRSSNGELLLFIPNATVTAGGTTLVRTGTLVVP